MLIAKRFPEVATVVRIGYDLALELVKNDVPDEVILKASDAADRNEAEQRYEEWRTEVRTRQAFTGITDQNPLEMFGREVAIALADAPEDLRRLAVDHPKGEVNALLDEFTKLTTEGASPDDAVAVIQKRLRGDSAPKPRRLPLRNLQVRLEALKAFVAVDVSDDTLALARDIEEKMLRLAQTMEQQQGAAP